MHEPWEKALKTIAKGNVMDATGSCAPAHLFRQLLVRQTGGFRGRGCCGGAVGGRGLAGAGGWLILLLVLVMLLLGLCNGKLGTQQASVSMQQAAGFASVEHVVRRRANQRSGPLS